MYVISFCSIGIRIVVLFTIWLWYLSLSIFNKKNPMLIHGLGLLYVMELQIYIRCIFAVRLSYLQIFLPQLYTILHLTYIFKNFTLGDRSLLCWVWKKFLGSAIIFFIGWGNSHLIKNFICENLQISKLNRFVENSKLNLVVGVGNFSGS